MTYRYLLKMGKFTDIFVATLHGRQVLHELSTLHKKVNETDLCTFHTVGLSNSNIACLLSQFSKIDTDHNGTICLDELMEYFDLDQSDFVARVFDVMDEDGNGDINFREFVISCYNYCTLDQESMLTFAFDLYDADSSGYIDIYEVELMLTEVYSSNFQRNRNAIALLQKIQEWKKGVNGSRRLCHLSFKDFKTFAKTHNLLLFPAFMLQQALRKKLLSRGFWERCTKRRKELLKVNCTKNDLDVIKQGEYQVKQRLSTLDMERRSSKASGIGFGRLSKRMQNWRQTNIAKKQLAARQLEKYVVTQIKTTQGPLCNRVRARVDYKDDQELPPDLRAPTKKPSRNSSYMSNNQGGGFRHENTIYSSMALEDDHAKDHTVPGNGKEIERVSVISTLVNFFGVGRRSGRASAVVDVLPSDEVGGVKSGISEEHNKQQSTNNKSDRTDSLSPSGSGDVVHVSGGAAGLHPTMKKISIEPPPHVKTKSGGIHALFPSNQGVSNSNSILNSNPRNGRGTPSSKRNQYSSSSNMERDTELHSSPSSQGSAESFTPTFKRSNSGHRMPTGLQQQRPGSFVSLSSTDTLNSLKYSTPPHSNRKKSTRPIRSSITPQDIQRKSYRRSIKMPGMISTM